MTNFKMLSKRIPTNEEGIFYKSIINDNGKEVDKVLQKIIDKVKVKTHKINQV
ncbi:hypothetical protein [Arcobacter cloacae]|uniref:hypothetical protein n=1 Tax=Arcobacter cloacae TaxID=1054034 RepID=UPI0013E9459F|nr:hypothetical protein [Arcobacter cloacae]